MVGGVLYVRAVSTYFLDERYVTDGTTDRGDWSVGKTLIVPYLHKINEKCKYNMYGQGYDDV